MPVPNESRIETQDQLDQFITSALTMGTQTLMAGFHQDRWNEQHPQWGLPQGPAMTFGEFEIGFAVGAYSAALQRRFRGKDSLDKGDIEEIMPEIARDIQRMGAAQNLTENLVRIKRMWLDAFDSTLGLGYSRG